MRIVILIQIFILLSWVTSGIVLDALQDKSEGYKQGYEDGKQFILDALKLEDSLSRVNTLQPYMRAAIEEMNRRKK